jgi:hypothetical protein
MRMRAVQNLGHQHALHLDIGRAGRRELDRATFFRFADDLPCLRLRGATTGPRSVDVSSGRLQVLSLAQVYLPSKLQIPIHAVAYRRLFAAKRRCRGIACTGFR